ncbi:MAG: ImmA/IrrE family metallo-endopeptidase [Dethiobacteria bacterium]|jgi:Zn-dependent peptidase ImmA (M78 family)
MVIQLNFRKKRNGIPILSKKEIDNMAAMLLMDYDPELLEQPTSLDIELFAENYIGLEMDYKDLTPNRSILGAMVFGAGYTEVYDIKKGKMKPIPVAEGTVIIDNSLLSPDQLRRGRFTLGHEIGHWLLHRHLYSVNKKQLTLLDDPLNSHSIIKCRHTDIENPGRGLETDDDWLERHADYMSAALLMPKKTFRNAANRMLRQVGLRNNYYLLGTDHDLDLWAEQLPRDFADIFEVSIASAKIRLQELGIIVEPKPGQGSILTTCLGAN